MGYRAKGKPYYAKSMDKVKKQIFIPVTHVKMPVLPAKKKSLPLLTRWAGNLTKKLNINTKKS